MVRESRRRRACRPAAFGPVAVGLAAALAFTACDPGALPLPQPPAAHGPGVPGPEFRVAGGVGQISVRNATPSSSLRITGPLGQPSEATATHAADRFGSLVVRDLSPGSSYRVVDAASGSSASAMVLAADQPPDASFYQRTKMQEGLNYIPMRDGTLLAATVRLPLGASLDDGPFPTLIEYSGYDVAAPADPLVARAGNMVGLRWGESPLVPGPETLVGGVVARLAGYAVVSVQLRGSGCSGGEADLLGPVGAADGYDAVETVAAQWWAQGRRIGMIGISFSGFSQLVVAATHPPHLAAIAPLSFLGRLWDVAWPGGIRNDGFAENWVKGRVAAALPAPAEGALPSANALVATDPYCRENQRLRLQTRDALDIFQSTDTMIGDFLDRDFTEAMDAIDVPVFGALQYQDEQTASTPMRFIERLTDHNPRSWVTLSSGIHNDAISPETLTDMFQFLDLYVAHRSPEAKLPLMLAAPLVFGEGTVPMPWPSLFGLPYRDALRRWEAQPHFRYGMERAVTSGAGASGVRWSFTSPQFPPTATTATPWYIGAGGALARTVGASGSVTWRNDPAARPRTIENTWSAVPTGTGVGFVSAPLAADAVVAGPIAADLWLGSSAADTDVQVTLTEVRPDGKEMLVSTGFQRGSQRRIDPALDLALEPGHTYVNPEPLAPGANLVRVQVLPTGHAFRAGSRLRVAVGPVGGDRTAWAFSTVDRGVAPTDQLFFGAGHPSSITLPVVSGVVAPAGLPACPQVGQPCRTYVPAANGG